MGRGEMERWRDGLWRDGEIERWTMERWRDGEKVLTCVRAMCSSGILHLLVAFIELFWALAGNLSKGLCGCLSHETVWLRDYDHNDKTSIEQEHCPAWYACIACGDHVDVVHYGVSQFIPYCVENSLTVPYFSNVLANPFEEYWLPEGIFVDAWGVCDQIKSNGCCCGLKHLYGEVHRFYWLSGCNKYVIVFCPN
jgi:hypothetical protein